MAAPVTGCSWSSYPARVLPELVLTWCLALVCNVWTLLIGAAAGLVYTLLYALGLVCAGLLTRAACHAAVSRWRKVGVTAPQQFYQWKWVLT